MSPDLLQRQVRTKERSLTADEPQSRRSLLRKMSGLPDVRETKLNLILDKALLDRAQKKKEVRVG